MLNIFQIDFIQKSIFYALFGIRRFQKKKYSKKILEIIENLLDEVVLAVWFMDDGGSAPNTPSATKINITAFSDSDQILLQKALYAKFGLEVPIQKQGGNNQKNFYITTKSYPKF